MDGWIHRSIDPLIEEVCLKSLAAPLLTPTPALQPPGDLKTLSVLLSGSRDTKAVDPEMKTGSGNSAMLLAGKAGQSEIVESLLMYSADVHRMSRAGETALHGAVSQPWQILWSNANSLVKREFSGQTRILWSNPALHGAVILLPEFSG